MLVAAGERVTLADTSFCSSGGFLFMKPRCLRWRFAQVRTRLDAALERQGPAPWRRAASPRERAGCPLVGAGRGDHRRTAKRSNTRSPYQPERIAPRPPANPQWADPSRKSRFGPPAGSGRRSVNRLDEASISGAWYGRGLNSAGTDSEPPGRAPRGGRDLLQPAGAA